MEQFVDKEEVKHLVQMVGGTVIIFRAGGQSHRPDRDPRPQIEGFYLKGVVQFDALTLSVLLVPGCGHRDLTQTFGPTGQLHQLRGTDAVGVGN